MRLFAKGMMAVLLAAAVSVPFASVAFADDGNWYLTAADLNRKGTVTVEFKDANGAVGGGNLKAYQVAQAETDAAGNVSWQALAWCASVVGDQDLAGGEESFSSEVAGKAAELAADSTVAPSFQVSSIPADGVAVLTDVPVGVYVVVQDVPAENRQVISPFLVSMPGTVTDGQGVASYTFDVVATPKTQVGTPVESETPPSSNPPVTKTDTTLPQTGQLLWPIPLLAAAGAICLAGGYRLSRKKA